MCKRTSGRKHLISGGALTQTGRSGLLCVLWGGGTWGERGEACVPNYTAAMLEKQKVLRSHWESP